jgi:hypothetical protein
VHIRAEGPLAEWRRYATQAQLGFNAGIRSQFDANPSYLARLRANGYVNPAAISFEMIYGSVGVGPEVEPDLQFLFGNVSADSYAKSP